MDRIALFSLQSMRFVTLKKKSTHCHETLINEKTAVLASRWVGKSPVRATAVSCYFPQPYRSWLVFTSSPTYSSLLQIFFIKFYRK
jgi:hypothetical protein